MALKSDAPGFFAAHDDFALQHQVADVLEADAVLDELTAMFATDAVKHFGGVEGAGHGAGPTLVLEHPA